jgi:hypothetical protein
MGTWAIQRRVLLCTMLLLVALSGPGCVTMSEHQRDKLAEVKAAGLRVDRIQAKNVVLAGALNLLPGFGNYYLAIGSDETPQWLFGTLNLLIWPYSVVWGVPEAAIDAYTMNKKATADYYEYNPSGIVELEEAQENPHIDTPAPTENVPPTDTLPPNHP